MLIDGGYLRLPIDFSSVHTRENYPELKKFEKYTGIIKVCDYWGIDYGNYINGKLNGNYFRYNYDELGGQLGIFYDLRFINIFELFRKPKLIKIETFKNGIYISSVQFDYYSGKKTSEKKIIEDGEIVKKNYKGYYDNGQMEWRNTILTNDNNRKELDDYWDRSGKKISKSEWEAKVSGTLGEIIKYKKRNFIDFIGITIIPFSLFLIFILYRRKKKLKKTD
tara:strand:- start:479 stop:1144 length:666 start_codon:yes stop_codon:yes gene_type:complete